ncbi:11750_t:CDS:1, partial [Funneliformis geosporum]
LPSWDKKLFNTLNNLHLFDSFKLKFDQLCINYPTFNSYKSTSWIDYIWTSTIMVQHILDCKTVEVTSQLSDHLIVIVKFENFLDIKHNRRNIPLKRVFDFNKMTEESWKLF